MDTQVLTPHQIFNMPQRLLVPLFQRPYVWNQDLQWEPLWKDLQGVADRYLENPTRTQQPHFLGAVVFQQLQNPAGDLQQRTVIDGQQRLTTLQILFDAIHAELVLIGADTAAARIEPMIENGKPFQSKAEDRFKVWPTNKDRAAFREVMAAEHPISYDSLKHTSSRLVQAHKYFAIQCRSWLLEEGEEEKLHRADALERSARDLLQIVVIDLAADENAQEIFETLNARGAALTAADLIKNFIFQRLLEQETDVESAYATYWEMFETAFWEQEISAGRMRYQRSSLFINHWMIAKTGMEVLAREVFSRFKAYADYEAKVPMLDLLQQIHSAALQYKGIVEASEIKDGDIDRRALFAYRLSVLDLDVMRPLFLYLLDTEEVPIPKTELDDCLDIIESWMIRRMLVRATTKSYNKLVPEVVALLKQNRTHASDILRHFFSNQSVESAYWPDDGQVRVELTSVEFYRKILRARVRMVFEAIEDSYRGWANGSTSKSGMRVRRSSYAIEHLMPQAWQSYWPISSEINHLLMPQAWQNQLPSGSAKIDDRNHTVQTIGNLTLLTTKLNSSVSNGSWHGENGKSASLTEHDVLLVNKRAQQLGEDGWDEKKINVRTQDLIDEILQIWRVPPGHISYVQQVRTQSSVKVNVIDLISAGMVSGGQVLYPKQPKFFGMDARILADGRIEVEDKIFDSLSGAGSFVRGGNTNGWTFWLVDQTSRKSMLDIHHEYQAIVGLEYAEDDTHSQDSADDSDNEG